MDTGETIAAISTPYGEGGIGIVRISGEDAFLIGERIFSPGRKKTGGYPDSHRLYHGHIHSGQNEPIDEVLVSFMKAPHTYTREDTVEINCHSGILTLRMILERVLQAGARMAEPGEFTRRAFLNGRIDLSQAESTIKLIRARSEEAAKAAVSNLQGRLSKRITELRQRMLDLLSRVEAQLDFPEDLEDDRDLERELQKELGEMKEVLSRMSRSSERGQIMQEGLVSAILGKPNAGKSSLLNALLQEQRAIVHELPGTTRDLLEGYLTVSGYPLRLLDTAGIHMTEDPVERAGIKMAKEAVTDARLMIIVLDGSTAWDEDDEAVVRLIRPGQLVVIVINKIDRPQQIGEDRIRERFPEYPVVRTAAVKNEGIASLEKTIGRLLDLELGTTPLESPVMVSLRHAAIVEEVRKHLEMALQASFDRPIELVSIDLREAWWKLGEITGENVSEELLDRIFSEFCIGK